MNTFLGEPPANIKQWIIDHATLAPHADTRFTLEGGTVETYNITGTLDRQWMRDNGYWNDDNGWIWTKTITQADIGNTVTSIGADVFAGCSGLTSMTIGNGVTSIGTDAFGDCYGLTSMTISNGVTSIGDWAFYNCSGLKSVKIPDGVTSIGEGAFAGCSGLTSVTITFNGGNANNVKQMIITAIGDTSISDNITWNMPS